MFKVTLEALDLTTTKLIESGSVASDECEFSNTAFAFYVDRHGIPKTADEARRMFEFAVNLDKATSLTIGITKGLMQHMTTRPSKPPTPPDERNPNVSMDSKS